jgi:hypothetical protein
MERSRDRNSCRSAVPRDEGGQMARGSIVTRRGSRFGATCLVTVLSLSACTYQRAYLSYPYTAGKIPVKSTSVEGERLGIVHGHAGGPVWANCTDVAENSIWVLIEQTTRLGGNAVGDVRWFPPHASPNPEEAVCRQRWGWILIWPMLLTPAFQVAEVEATAYRVSPDTTSSSLYVIPDSPAERAELVARISRQTLPKSP